MSGLSSVPSTEEREDGAPGETRTYRLKVRGIWLLLSVHWIGAPNCAPKENCALATEVRERLKAQFHAPLGNR